MRGYKKIFLLLFVSLFENTCVFSQISILLDKEDGVYKVPCKVNGAKIKFILDTGASSVCLSESMANYLFENEYIAKADIIGKGKYQIADGSINEQIEINIKDIEIGGIHISNIKATIIQGQKAPLLLGQSALKKLGDYTISNNKLIIHNDTCSRKKNIETWKKLIEKYVTEGNYEQAYIYLEKLNDIRALNPKGVCKLINHYYDLKNSSKYYNLCLQYLEDYENLNEEIDIARKKYIYSILELYY